MGVSCLAWMLILSSASTLVYSCITGKELLMNWTMFDNLTIRDNNQMVLYHPGQYVTEKNGDENEYFGCICVVKTCIRKCCSPHENLGEELNCVPRLDKGTDFLVNLTDFKNKRTYLMNESSKFRWIYGLEDYEWYSLDPEEYISDVYYINAVDGKLTTPNNKNKTYGIEDYCIDYFNQTKRYKVFIRFRENHIDASRRVKGTLYPILMILSLPPLLITFIIYASIEELRNLHGFCLLSYVADLFFLYLFFALGHNGINWLPVGACSFVGFSCIFWFHGVFFWLNAMGLDVCITFSNINPIKGTKEEKEKKKFIFYSLYCWGCSAIILVAAIVIDYAPNIPKYIVRTGIGIDRCWFQSKDAELYFCYAPASILMISNVFMFILTAINFMKFNREMLVIKKAGGGTNEDKCNKSLLYLKISLLMGINWVLELTSWAMETAYYLWYISDVFNCLQGFFIFYFFVWTGKPKELVKKKFFRQRKNSGSQVAIALKWKPESELLQQKSAITDDTSSTEV